MSDDMVIKVKRHKELKEIIIPQKNKELRELRSEYKELGKTIEEYINTQQPKGFALGKDEYRLEPKKKTKAKKPEEKLSAIQDVILNCDTITDDNIVEIGKKIMDALKGKKVEEKSLVVKQK